MSAAGVDSTEQLEEPVASCVPVLPESLESITKAESLPGQRHRWNTNEEIASILISFEKHETWLTKEVQIRPHSGSMLLYSRKRVRYRKDGYCWKKRKDGKTTREDHMKLKVQGTECIYGCYVHSAILPTFHRRCYWLLQNPDIVLVHYLNAPFSDDSKMLTAPTLSCCADAKEWTKEELMAQLRPMFYLEEDEVEIGQKNQHSNHTNQQDVKASTEHAKAYDSNNKSSKDIRDTKSGKFFKDPRDVKKLTSLNAVESMVNQLLEKQKEKVSCHEKGPECPCDSTTKPPTPKTVSVTAGHQSAIVSVHTPRSEAPIVQITTQPMTPITTQSITVVNPSDRSSQHQASGITAKKINAIHPVHRIISPRNLTPPTIVSTIPSNPVSSSTAVKAETAATMISLPTVSNATSNAATRIVSPQLPIVSTAGAVAATTSTPASVLLAPCRPLNGDTSRPSFILNLSQLRGGGGLLILNGQTNTSNGLTGASVTPLTLVCGPNNQAPTVSQLPATPVSIAMTDGTLTRVTVQASANGQTISIPSPSSFSVGASPITANGAPVPAGPIQRVSESTVPCSVSSSVPDTFAVPPLTSPRLIQVKRENVIHVKAETPDSASLVVDAKPSPPEEDMQVMQDDLLPMCVTNRANSPPFRVLTPTSLQLPTGPLDISDIFNAQVQNNGGFCGHKDDFMTDFGGPSVSSSDNTHTMLKTELKTEPLDFADVPTASLAQHLSHSSAHMAGSIGDGAVGDFNTMDFIEHNIGGNEEDGFNIETFDMLESVTTWEDLNDINNLTSSQVPVLQSIKQQNSMKTISSPSSSQGSPTITMQSSSLTSSTSAPDLLAMHCDSINGTPDNYRVKMLQVRIADYSPDWAYTTGGVKVLIAGDWTHSNSDGQFSILFDGMSVPTTVVQNGLLGCYCPSHEPGLVTLQVVVDDFAISNTVRFEYRAGEDRTAPAVTPVEIVESYDAIKAKSCFNREESALKFSLMERLETVEARFVIPNACKGPPAFLAKALAAEARTFEQRMVSVCTDLMTLPWSPAAATTSLKTSDLEHMSLLHLSAALGYSKLISTLLRWRNENTSLLLETEVDALNRDYYDNTPLHWACAKGHRKVVQQLLSWNPAATHIFNSKGEKPEDSARYHGFEDIMKPIQVFDPEPSIVHFGRRAPKRPSAIPLRTLLTLSQKSSADSGTSGVGKNAHKENAHVDVVESSSTSPIVDVVSISEDEEVDSLAAINPFSSMPASSDCEVFDLKGLNFRHQRVFNICLYADEEQRILNLAQQIIAALPERIKGHVQDYEDETQNAFCDSPIRFDSPIDAKEEELLAEEFDASLEGSTSSLFSSNFQFDLADQSYWFTDEDTSTFSPSSSTRFQSPGPSRIMEHDFSKLTLSEAEQRKLYEAAITIQKAFRIYKGRKLSEHQEEDLKEREAAVLIQNYYRICCRRYKQYLYHKRGNSSRYFDISTPSGSGFIGTESSKRFKMDTNNEPSLSSSIDHDLDKIFGGTAASTLNIQDSVPSTSGLKKPVSPQKKRSQAAKKIQDIIKKKSQNGMATRSSWNNKTAKNHERANASSSKRQEKSTTFINACRTQMKVYGGLRSTKSQKGLPGRSNAL